MLSASGFKVQRAAQRHDQLADRRGMPIEFPARAGFLKRNRGDRQFARENVAVRAAIEVNHAFLEKRIVVIPGPNAHTSNHRHLPLASQTVYLAPATIRLSRAR